MWRRKFVCFSCQSCRDGGFLTAVDPLKGETLSLQINSYWFKVVPMNIVELETILTSSLTFQPRLKPLEIFCEKKAFSSQKRSCSSGTSRSIWWKSSGCRRIRNVWSSKRKVFPLCVGTILRTSAVSTSVKFTQVWNFLIFQSDIERRRLLEPVWEIPSNPQQNSDKKCVSCRFFKNCLNT